MKQLHFLASTGLLIWLLSSANMVQAQQPGLSEASSVSQRLVEDFGLSAGNRLLNSLPANTRNLAELVQLGNSNKATAEQNNPGTTANQAYITQVGFANVATLGQQGSGNKTVTNQLGQGNSITSLVTGDNNTTKLNQIGIGNNIMRDVTTDDADFKLTQFGNNNSLRQTGTQSLAPPRYEVEMRGNGIQLSIQNGRIGQ